MNAYKLKLFVRVPKFVRIVSKNTNKTQHLDSTSLRTKITGSYTHALTIVDRVYATLFTSIFAEMAVSSNVLVRILWILLKAHDSSLSHFEGGKITPYRCSPKSDLALKKQECCL